MKRQEVIAYLNEKFNETIDEIDERGLVSSESISGVMLLGTVDGATVFCCLNPTKSRKLDVFNTMYVFAGAVTVEEIENVHTVFEREASVMFEMPIAEQPNSSDIANMTYALQHDIYDEFGEDTMMSVKFGFMSVITGNDLGTIVLNCVGSVDSLLDGIITARNNFLDTLSDNAAKINRSLAEPSNKDELFSDFFDPQPGNVQ